MKPILLDLPMPIITPRLLLRPPRIGEGKMLNTAVLESFEVLHQFMHWAKEKPSTEESEEIVRHAAANWILKKNDEPYLLLFILDKKTGDFIGASGFHHYDWDIPSLEMGYWIRKKYSRQGFMTEAVNAQTQYALNALGAKRVVITCDVDNISSKKIPERLGFTLEATLKSSRKKPDTDQLSDTLLFAKYNLDGLPELKVSWGNPLF